MFSFSCIFLTLYQHASKSTIWQYGTLAKWGPGNVGPWQYETLAKLDPDNMGPWKYGDPDNMGPWEY